MDKKAAAHLMVEAREQTETLNAAVEWVLRKRPDFEDAYLRLIWLGVNAQANSANRE